ncbi:MAG: TetR/AcrR family transcriptional regulator [Polyangiales bacterium]|nr:TetR/AcrR family transcriptional regulator [Sandaracinaceae bacterium]
MARPPDGRAKRRPGVDAQRRHLLDTAIVLFAERGSRQVSINDLCAAAEVSRPTFYRCFTDKDGLVEALYREAVMGPIESIVLSSLATRAREPGWLRRANDEMLDAIFAEAPAAALLFVESADPTSQAHAIIQRAFDDIGATLRKVMRKAGAQPLSPVAQKAMLVACQFIVHDAIQKGLTAKARREAKEATWELAKRVFATPVPKPAP